MRASTRHPRGFRSLSNATMKPLLPRPVRALCVIAICTLAAACGGGGGSTPVGSCFYTYPPGLPPLLTGADPLLAEQWHLDNTGQTGGLPGEDLRAFGAWILQPARGQDVRIAIVDDAIETVHEDLAPNVADWFDYRAGAAAGSAPLPCEQDDDHGTKVAGIVLARDANAVGGAGVAPRARLGAYNPLSTNTNADIADALTRDSAITGAYNNSWGSPDNGLLQAADASFVTTIRNGIANGRSGRGSVYVFPAGNGGCFMVDPVSRSCVYDENSNFDGYVNQLGVIPVCAVDDRGLAPRYAEPGANILVCGPSGSEGRAPIATTAPLSSYGEISGTSASTPMVTGVVALMLRENPQLTWRDVRLILAYSARKNDAADAGWTSNFGLNHSPKYGFGVADAEQAVLLARSWPSVGGSATLESCSYQRGPGAPFPLAVTDNDSNGRLDEVDASACPINRIEFIEVDFTAVHPFSGDLRVELTSPSGLVSLLANERLCDADADGSADDCGTYSGWTFGSTRHLDESPRGPGSGNWRLTVSDRIAGDEGQWISWNLRLWGRR
ncbi:MAG: serine protease [Burkholderiales bacterium]|nr:MAG: serine protease [Burkholderiales bacterium]